MQFLQKVLSIFSRFVLFLDDNAQENTDVVKRFETKLLSVFGMDWSRWYSNPETSTDLPIKRTQPDANPLKICSLMLTSAVDFVSCDKASVEFVFELGDLLVRMIADETEDCDMVMQTNRFLFQLVQLIAIRKKKNEDTLDSMVQLKRLMNATLKHKYLEVSI